jgi:RNA polymerase sigma factor (sigma-70 family)
LGPARLVGVYWRRARRYSRLVNPALNDWFVQEVLPYEKALARYLSRAWPNRSEVDDLLQEVYVRVYEAAEKAKPLAVKPFLFATARHLITDRLRRGRVVSIEAVGDSDSLNVFIDEITPERSLNARQELKLLARVFDDMSPRCREVVWLRRVDELTQKEVAERLGISHRTVETYLERAAQLLADALFMRNAHRVKKRLKQAADEELGHGK